MEIKRSGTQPSAGGPADYFTGTVRIDPLFSPPDPARVAMALVHLRARRPHGVAHAPARPNADRHRRLRLGRSATAARSRRSEPATSSWFPPGERHWHGAAATTAMSHIAVQEKQNGSPVDWLEQVTDEQYRR